MKLTDKIDEIASMINDHSDYEIDVKLIEVKSHNQAQAFREGFGYACQVISNMIEELNANKEV